MFGGMGHPGMVGGMGHPGMFGVTEMITHDHPAGPPPSQKAPRVGTMISGKVKGGGAVELWASKFDTVDDMKASVAREYGASPSDIRVFLNDTEEMQASRHVIRDPYAADGVGDAYQLGEGSSVILVCNAAALRCFPKCGLQVSNYTPAQLGAYFHRVFSAADSDGNGVLDVAEVETLLSNTGFKLTPEQVQQVISLADTNQDGVLSYEEFVPVMVAALQTQHLNPDKYTPEQLSAYFTKIFSAADVNGDGVLDQAEVEFLLSNTGFKFSPSQVAELVAAADTNQDGVLSYTEFVPLMLEVLRGKQLKPGNYTQDQLHMYFKRLFMLGDENGDGTLQMAEVERLLSMSAFRLEKDEIQELMVLADVNRDGVIDYSEFVPLMMAVLAPPDLLMAKYSQAQLSVYFKELFRVADTNGDGVLSPKELEHLLSSTGFKFTTEQVAKFMSVADTSGDGYIQYDEFVPMMMALL